MVASHELTHAFDSSGRMYNQDGKLEEWWTNATSEGFNKKQQCIQDQYSCKLSHLLVLCSLDLSSGKRTMWSVQMARKSMST